VVACFDSPKPENNVAGREWIAVLGNGSGFVVCRECGLHVANKITSLRYHANARFFLSDAFFVMNRNLFLPRI
jgi:hypothetical protein